DVLVRISSVPSTAQSTFMHTGADIPAVVFLSERCQRLLGLAMQGAVARCSLLQGIYQLFRRDICLYRRSLIALEAGSCVMVIVLQSFIAELFKLRLDFVWHSFIPF